MRHKPDRPAGNADTLGNKVKARIKILGVTIENIAITEQVIRMEHSDNQEALELS